jgi:hypothetical protein
MILIALVAATALNGFTISLMWGWFVVPALGAPAISIMQALGLGLLVSYLTPIDYDRVESVGAATGIMRGMVKSVVMLLIGAVYIFIMGV